MKGKIIMLYKFECRTTDKDYYEFNKYHTTDSPDVKKSGLIGKLYVPVIFLIMFIFDVFESNTDREKFIDFISQKTNK